jgi:hypothetical protein
LKKCDERIELKKKSIKKVPSNYNEEREMNIHDKRRAVPVLLSMSHVFLFLFLFSLFFPPITFLG